MTSNPGVSSECHQHHLLSHNQASMKQGTVRSRCSREADGCFIMKSTSRRCDVMLPTLWFCKRRNTGAANELCQFQTPGCRGLNQGIVGCVSRPIQKRWSEWQSLTLWASLCVSLAICCPKKWDQSPSTRAIHSSQKKHKTVQCQTFLEFNRLSQELQCDKSKALVEGCTCVLLCYRYFPSALYTERHRPFRNWNCGMSATSHS